MGMNIKNTQSVLPGNFTKKMREALVKAALEQNDAILKTLDGQQGSAEKN